MPKVRPGLEGLNAETVLRGMRARLAELPPLEASREIKDLPLPLAARLLGEQLPAGFGPPAPVASIDDMITELLAAGDRSTTAEIKERILQDRHDVKPSSIGAALARLKRAGTLTFRPGLQGTRDGTYELSPQAPAARRTSGKPQR
jgi:hypothetical protein